MVGAGLNDAEKQDFGNFSHNIAAQAKKLWVVASGGMGSKELQVWK